MSAPVPTAPTTPTTPRAATGLAARTDALRAFNRFYTGLIGALGGRHLHSPYSLTEARILYELAHGDDTTDVRTLRGDLDLDASYLSRILAKFEADGLIRRDRSEADARRQVAALTAKGRDTFASLDSRATDDVHRLLADLTDTDQARLTAAMAVVREVLGDAPRPPACVLRPLRPGDLGWVVHRNAYLYAEEYGWDASYEALVARIVADYIDQCDPACETGWIAEMGGDPVGAVFCVRKDGETAQLRLLLVEPTARGFGIGARLVDECVRFARRAGYRRLVLWTNDVLTHARRIYERAGFTLEREESHHSFGKDLVGQWWGLDLTSTESGSGPGAESANSPKT
jgi:DNA-binding MarR family transcriptional regulator/GNAT superfamily N-acetyltransferase